MGTPAELHGARPPLRSAAGRGRGMELWLQRPGGDPARLRSVLEELRPGLLLHASETTVCSWVRSGGATPLVPRTRARSELDAPPAAPAAAAAPWWERLRDCLEETLAGDEARVLVIAGPATLGLLIEAALALPAGSAAALRLDPGRLVLLRDDPQGLVLRRANVVSPRDECGTALPGPDPAPGRGPGSEGSRR